MGAFADSLFEVLMSWVRALVNSIWALFVSDDMTVLEFFGKNWMLLLAVLLAAGLVIDWTIWMIRWRPYTLWAQRARRLLRIAPQEDDVSGNDFDDEEAADLDFADGGFAKGNTAVIPTAVGAEYGEWLPEPPDAADAVLADEGGKDEEEILRQAQAVSDEELGAYPGMRYDENAPHAAAQDGTRRFAAIHQEGPGAAEVLRRRAEIDAWQQQMQEEARLERERRMAQARQQEEARLAQEAQAMRLAQEAQREEEERRAQEEYARQLEAYEREKARYEREMAQYRRDLAAYEAAIAAQQADAEASQELEPAAGSGRTRRRTRDRAAAYSDLIQGEAVEQLPDTPQWPRPEQAYSDAKQGAGNRENKTNGLIGRMAYLIEPERPEVTGVNALPPRVDVHDAYKPAAKPQSSRVRRKS